MKTLHPPLFALFMAALLCSCNPGTHVSTGGGKIVGVSYIGHKK